MTSSTPITLNDTNEKLINEHIQNYKQTSPLKPQGQGKVLKKLSVIASNKSNSLRKIHFFLKSGFQLIAFFNSFRG